MRKIEREMVGAVAECFGNASLSGQVWRSANTTVRQDHSGVLGTPSYDRVVDVILHETTIARFDPAIQRLTLRTNGWHTRTTASRINALLATFSPGWQVFSKRGTLQIREDDWTPGISHPLTEGREVSFKPIALL